MCKESNLVHWLFSDQAGKDQIIINLMNRVDELEQERNQRKGVPPELLELERRTKKPNSIA